MHLVNNRYRKTMIKNLIPAKYQLEILCNERFISGKVLIYREFTEITFIHSDSDNESQGKEKF